MDGVTVATIATIATIAMATDAVADLDHLQEEDHHRVMAAAVDVTTTTTTTTTTTIKEEIAETAETVEMVGVVGMVVEIGTPVVAVVVVEEVPVSHPSVRIEVDQEIAIDVKAVKERKPKNKPKTNPR